MISYLRSDLAIVLGLDQDRIQQTLDAANAAIDLEQAIAEAIKAVNTALDGESTEVTLAALQHPKLGMQNVDAAGAEQEVVQGLENFLLLAVKNVPVDELRARLEDQLIVARAAVDMLVVPAAEIARPTVRNSGWDLLPRHG